MDRWTVQPLIPASLWLALAAGGALLLIIYALRRPAVVSATRWASIVGLMSAALALVLLLLLNPTRVEQLPPPAGKPLLTVLVDATASMATPDVDGKSRYLEAVRTASLMVDSLSDRFDVRVRSFTDSAPAADPKDLATRQPTGQSTDIAAAIASCLDEDRPQGQAVALLSDGAHNAGAVSSVLEAAHLAKSMASPVYTRTFGGDAGGIDLGIELRSPQDLAFVGQNVLVTARVTHVGLSSAHPNVSLLYNGQEVARQQVDLPESAPGEAKFWVKRDKSGVYPFELRVEPLPGEMTQANNAASYLLRVVDEPIHILQVEGKPYWDSKFLMRTLASVAAVELDSAVRITDTRVVWRTIGGGNADELTTQPAPPAAPSTQPQRAEKWKVVTDPAAVLGSADSLKRYQIIVLGRDAEAFLTDAALANLQNWVAHDGGALICYRGSPTSQANQRLERLMPVRWTPAHENRFHVKMTDQGRDLHWLDDSGQDDLLARLPTLASTSQQGKAKPLAVVLAKTLTGGEESPAVVYQPYGAGRVVVIEGAGMWRWAFLPPQYQKQEEIYGGLWHSMLRWLVSATGLMPGQKMTLKAEKLSFALGETASVSLLVREEAMNSRLPGIELLPEGAKQGQTYQPVPAGEDPGAFRVSFGKLPEGRYQARLIGAGPEDAFSRTVFDVRRVGDEELNLKARPDLMERIAADSGGAVLQSDPASELSQKFTEHQAGSSPPRTRRTTAWDRWWVLAAVLGIWGASWWLRRSGGLV